MRKVSLIVVGLVLFGLVGSASSQPKETPKPKESSKPKDMIIGKWTTTEKMPDLEAMKEAMKDPKQGDKVPAMKMKDISIAIEFTKEGVMTMEVAGIKKDAKYTFIDDNTIEMELEFMGQKKKDKVKVESITKDKMVIVSIEPEDKAKDKKEDKKEPKRKEFTRAK